MKTIEAVSTDKAPKAIGPYSQAIKSGGFVFTSGQIALDPKSGQMVGTDVATQVKQVMTNLKAVVEASGSTMEKVTKCVIYLKDMGDFPIVNEAYGSYFKGTPPARSTVQVAKLPKDALVEIDAVAVV